MIAFGHTAVGAIVGVGVYNLLPDKPIEGLLAAGTVGVVSHYITDFIPHGHLFKHNQYKKKVWGIIVFDLLLSLSIFIGLSLMFFGPSMEFLYILFAIGGAQLPDVIDGLIYIKVIKPRGLIKIENDFHQWLHWHGSYNKALLWGRRDIWQVLTVFLALFILFRI